MVNVVKAKPNTAEQSVTEKTEGVESLDALAREAEQVEAAPVQAMQEAQQQEAQQTAETTAKELEAVARIVRDMAMPLVPDHQRERIAAAWSDQVLQNASRAGAEVMTLHGWTLGEAMGKYGPYIALAAALAPPTLTTIRVLKEPPPEKANDGQQQ